MFFFSPGFLSLQDMKALEKCVLSKLSKEIFRVRTAQLVGGWLLTGNVKLQGYLPQVTARCPAPDSRSLEPFLTEAQFGITIFLHLNVGNVPLLSWLGVWKGWGGGKREDVSFSGVLANIPRASQQCICTGGCHCFGSELVRWNSTVVIN